MHVYHSGELRGPIHLRWLENAGLSSPRKEARGSTSGRRDHIPTSNRKRELYSRYILEVGSSQKSPRLEGRCWRWEGRKFAPKLRSLIPALSRETVYRLRKTPYLEMGSSLSAPRSCIQKSILFHRRKRESRYSLNNFFPVAQENEKCSVNEEATPLSLLRVEKLKRKKGRKYINPPSHFL